MKISVNYITVALVTMLSLTACSDKPIGDSYFPLQKGLEWKYQVTTRYEHEVDKETLTISNLGKKTIDDKSYFVRRTSSGIDYYINFDDQGVYRQALRTLVELKPRMDAEKRFVFKYPLETGTNWRAMSETMILLNVFPFRQRTTGYYFPISYRIESLNETVTVPAGRFTNCLKVVGEGVTEIFTDAVKGMSEIPIIVEEWYAPNVGLVKQGRYEMDGKTIKISDTPAFKGGHTVLELISFED